MPTSSTYLRSHMYSKWGNETQKNKFLLHYADGIVVSESRQPDVIIFGGIFCLRFSIPKPPPLNHNPHGVIPSPSGSSHYNPYCIVHAHSGNRG